MNNACPECGAVYAIMKKDAGRRIACKKCSTLLVIDEDKGLIKDETDETDDTN
ncbi:MAG: zinc-ribbon domain-containing protein [Planctomycetes bacterium]|nr:zinc-ribbon domain-containing protein [Planctomycetota bacterium]